MSQQPTSGTGILQSVEGDNRRTAKVHYLYRGEVARPCLRLSGKWLSQLGFEVGRRFVVETSPGELRIRTLPKEST